MPFSGVSDRMLFTGVSDRMPFTSVSDRINRIYRIKTNMAITV